MPSVCTEKLTHIHIWNHLHLHIYTTKACVFLIRIVYVCEFNFVCFTFFINTITNLTAQSNINSFTSFSPLSEAEVSKLILSSHPTTCPLDPIPSHLLQAISPAVVPALTHIVNTSLHTGGFPSASKQARITPLLKKRTLNPTLLGNYRPVSLLPFIAKTLERVVFNQVTAFLTQNNLLDRNQSGFRSGHSTETALLSVVEDLRLARTASKSSLLILLDLSAAFDTVNHQILLSTLLRRYRTPVVWLLPLR